MGRRALGAVAIFVLLALVLFPRQGSGSHVDPVFLGYDASCSDLAPSGTTWHALDVEPVEDGTYSRGALTVSVDVDRDDTTTIDWSSNITVDGVFVKGGPGGNFYHYDPPTDADTELHPPINPFNGQTFDPSHMLFCTASSLNTPTATAPPPVTETSTPAPTATATPDPTATPMASPSTTPSPSPSHTPDPSITPTLIPTPTDTAVPGTATPVPTETPVPGHFSRVFFPAICVNCFVSPAEPNDSCASAYPILPGTPYEFLPDDQHDWYRFELQASAEVEVRVEEFAPLDGQLAAYSGDSCESARFLQNYGEPSPEKILSLGQQPAGTFFLYVSNDGDLSHESFYRLIVETR